MSEDRCARGELRLFAFGLSVIVTVALTVACESSERRSDAEPAPTGRDPTSVRPPTQALGNAIEGTYRNAHTVRTVDGAHALVEDVVEIVLYDPSHVFFRIVTRFDNGHSCSLYGIATLDDRAFTYSTRQLPVDNQGSCTLRVEATADELRITDRLEPNGPSTCREFCGVRGTLSDFAISRKHWRAVKDMTHVKSSTEFAEAVEEFNMREPAR